MTDKQEQKLNIKWDEPIPKAREKTQRSVYSSDKIGLHQWVIAHYPQDKKESRWYLCCMKGVMSLGASGKTYADACKNWIDRLSKSIEQHKQLLADIEAGKEL